MSERISDDGLVAGATQSAAEGEGRRSWRSWALHGLVVAGAAGAVVLDRRLRRSGRGGRRPIAPFAVAVGYHAVLQAVESRHPHDEAWRPSRPEVLVDLGFAASSMAAAGAGQALGDALRGGSSDAGAPRRAGLLPTAPGAVLAVAGYDLIHSQLHRLGHEWGPGWRVHSVHHSPARLYWFNASRFHVIEMLVEGVLEGFLIGLLGLTRDQHVAYTTVRVTYGQLQHCNIDLRSGALDHVFSTPDLHRWHHSTVYEEGDTNYGAVTSIWDKAFGTWFRPADRTCPDQLGVGRMPDFPTRFGDLQRVPFDWAAIKERNAETWDVPEGSSAR